MPRTPERTTPDLKIDWPTNSLTAEKIRWIVEGRDQKPLRVLIAQILVDEAVDLWRMYSQKYPSSPYNRSDQDLAINLGYKEVGALFLAATLQKDPTGLTLLQARLEEMRGQNGNVEPHVIGFEKGAERFKDLYKIAVKAGIRSDRPGFLSLIGEKIKPPVLKVIGEVRRAFSGATSWIY